MIFANVKSLTIPEGEVTKITVDGEILWNSVVNYTVTRTLTKVTCSNTASTITGGSSYTATLTASTGYSISSVKITMGGVDITSSAYTSSTRKISISKVTGDIVITAVATVISYTVTKYLSDCSSSNSAITATYGSSYTATLTADSGLYLYAQNVTITMGGRDITASAYNASTKKITISNVTGNIVITAEATERNYIVESTDENGDIFNGCGYTDSEEYNGDAYCATGFMPITRNDYVYFDSMEVCEGDKLVFYNSSYTELAVITVNFSDNYDRFSNDGEYATEFRHINGYTDSGLKATIFQTSGVYFRVFCQYIDEYSSIRISN